jgi:hypothetical protein
MQSRSMAGATVLNDNMAARYLPQADPRSPAPRAGRLPLSVRNTAGQFDVGLARSPGGDALARERRCRPGGGAAR